MTSRSSGSWAFPGMDYFRPAESKSQTNSNQRAGNEASTEPSGTRQSRSPSARSSSHDTKSHRLSRHMDHDDASETSGLSMSSTKASTGSAPPSSSSNSNSSSHQGTSLRPSRTTSKSASTARPGPSTAAPPARPVYGLEQEPYRPQLSHSATAPAYQRPTSMYASSTQPSIFGSQHGIRETPGLAPQPPVVSLNSSRPVAPLSANPFSTNAPGVNHLDLSGPMGPHVSQPSMQMHLPGAFPADAPTVPYRRPTDLTTQLSMSNSTISMDHFSGDNVWDSEGDSASCLSTSTTATSVMSDMTEKGDTYNITPTQTRTTTPTQTHGREPPQSRAVAETPRPSILRHTTQKSILSNGSKDSASSSSTKSVTSSHSSSRSYTSTSSSSAARSNTISAPHIHIEVNRSDSREHREHRDEARKRQLVEEALVDKIAQLKAEQNQAKEAKEARAAPAPAPAPAIKRVPSVRFAEPEKVKAKAEDKAARPTVSEQEKNLSKELVQQTKEVQKLELEIERSRLQAREKERAELERKLREEAAEAERKKEHERQLKKLQKEKAELENAQKERERVEREREKANKEREKERERAEREREKATKEREKADKERERARQKEKQQLDKKLSDIEKAQREHDKLQESFIDQGKILADLKTRFDAQARTLEATEAERAELQRIRDEFEKRCADLSKTLSHVSDKERFVVEQVASLQIIKESLQGRVGPLEARVDEQQGEITALHGERDGLYQDVKSYLHRITELENGMKGLVEEKHGLMRQVGALEKDKDGLEDRIRDRDGQIKSLASSLEARARETQQHIASLKDEHKQQMEGLEAAKDALVAGMTVGHDLRVQDLEEQIAVLNAHIDGAHADVEKFKESVKSLEVSLNEEKAKAGVEQSRANTLASERDTLLIQLDGHRLLAVDQEKDLIDLRTKLAASDGEVAKLLDSSKALEAEHEELKKKAASLEEDSKAEPQPTPADAPPPPPPPPEEPAPAPAPAAPPKPTVEDEKDVVVVEFAPPGDDKTEVADLQSANQQLNIKTAELEAKTADLEAKNAELTAEVESTRASLGERITQLEGERDSAASALIVAQVELGHTRAAADRVPALEEEAAKVPALEADKAGLEGRVAELAGQLAAANGLIAAMTAAQHDLGLGLGLNNGAHIPLPQSPPPSEPADIPIPPSPSLVGPPPPPPAPAPERRKVRSRAPSMARSVSSRSSAVSRKSAAGVRDDLALVVVRDAKDRGNITVVRKCDLRRPRSQSRSRSQGPVKD
ncbi:hypothetical protein KVR01_002426 [Diaporthe batatas]|uniref:uncharacterized protein n=1 Tax=Diaporthe batatas TaxID=748121 RepID=UPI001D0580BE|nr:uncharacterized protein KVR01_002426 [Diaporthe batatas]KAG8166737.1 hypothetical protein KVR01_002426 [Diaporthe batatas]